MEENRFVAPDNQEATEESIRDSGARPETGNAPEGTEGRSADRVAPEHRPLEDVTDSGLPAAPVVESDATDSEPSDAPAGEAAGDSGPAEALPQAETVESAPDSAEAAIDSGLPTAPMPEASDSESEQSGELVDTGLPAAPVVEADSTVSEPSDTPGGEAAGEAEAPLEVQATESAPDTADAVIDPGLPMASDAAEAGDSGPAEAIPQAETAAPAPDTADAAIDPGFPTAPKPEASESEPSGELVDTGLPAAPVVDADPSETAAAEAAADSGPAEAIPQAETAASAPDTADAAIDPGLPTAPMPEASDSESEPSAEPAEAAVDAGLPAAPVVDADPSEAIPQAETAASAPDSAEAAIDPGLPTTPMPEASDSESASAAEPAEAAVDTGLPAADSSPAEALPGGQTTDSAPDSADAAIDPGLPTASMVEGNTTEPDPSEPSPAEAEPVEPDQAPGPVLESVGASHPQPDIAGDGAMTADELLGKPAAEEPATDPTLQLRAVIEAIIYVTEEPLTKEQIAAALQQPLDLVKQVLGELSASFDKPEHGIGIREVAGGYKMATKPEHHDAVRNFVRSLKPPLKLSLAALETLAVIAYKQPVTAPEIAEIRGVQGTGVMKTLLDRKLIAAAGRKNVIGKPILYKTTKDFLVQFGLKDLSELPSLKEFEEIRRMAFTDEPAAEPLSAEAATGRQPAGDPPQEEPPVQPPPSEEPPVEPPPSEEPPVEPPPSEEPPVTEPPPSEEPKQSDGE